VAAIGSSPAEDAAELSTAVAGEVSRADLRSDLKSVRYSRAASPMTVEWVLRAWYLCLWCRCVLVEVSTTTGASPVEGAEESINSDRVPQRQLISQRRRLEGLTSWDVSDDGNPRSVVVVLVVAVLLRRSRYTASIYPVESGRQKKWREIDN
jgi:hypothetical protein